MGGGGSGHSLWFQCGRNDFIRVVAHTYVGDGSLRMRSVVSAWCFLDIIL